MRLLALTMVLTLACKGKCAAGCVNLGLMQADGAGTDKDLKAAAASFKKGCELGEPSGCKALEKLQAE